MADHEQRAIVIGGSVAGLLAARALRERFAHVTVLQRAAAQAPAHVHGVLAGGLAALESLFPGIEADAHGGHVVDVGAIGWSVDGVLLPSMHTGVRGLSVSHAELQRVLRARLAQYGNVELREATVVGLLGSAWKIEGVRLEGGEALPAALVVDASGMRSQVPDMLRRFGLKAPSEERVQVELRATSCLIEARDVEGFVHTPCAPTPRGGAVIKLDEDRCLVTLLGYLGAHAKPSYGAMTEFARGLPERTLYALLRDAKPLSEPVELRHPGSLRRRYDRMRHRPRGLLAIGGALCSLNPAYGHGMTLAALQAHALRRALTESDPRALVQRFFSEATRIVDIPWSMVAGSDLEFAGARATQPPPHPSVRAYFKRALRAATRDASVALAVYRVMHLVDPPSALFAPTLVSSVLGQREAPPAPTLKLVPDR